MTNENDLNDCLNHPYCIYDYTPASEDINTNCNGDWLWRAFLDAVVFVVVTI